MYIKTHTHIKLPFVYVCVYIYLYHFIHIKYAHKIFIKYNNNVKNIRLNRENIKKIILTHSSLLHL